MPGVFLKSFLCLFYVFQNSEFGKVDTYYLKLIKFFTMEFEDSCIDQMMTVLKHIFFVGKLKTLTLLSEFHIWCLWFVKIGTSLTYCTSGIILDRLNTDVSLPSSRNWNWSYKLCCIFCKWSKLFSFFTCAWQLVYKKNLDVKYFY